MNYNALIIASIALASVASPSPSKAATVPLQQATATFSQAADSGVYTPATSIDGVVDGNNGWAIRSGFPYDTNPQTAVFETTTDIGYAGGSILTFGIHQLNWNAGHTLGRFRLSVTTDDRGGFADGLANGGDVTAN